MQGPVRQRRPSARQVRHRRRRRATGPAPLRRHLRPPSKWYGLAAPTGAGVGKGAARVPSSPAAAAVDARFVAPWSALLGPPPQRPSPDDLPRRALPPPAVGAQGRRPRPVQRPPDGGCRRRRWRRLLLRPGRSPPDLRPGSGRPPPRPPQHGPALPRRRRLLPPLPLPPAPFLCPPAGCRGRPRPDPDPQLSRSLFLLLDPTAAAAAATASTPPRLLLVLRLLPGACRFRGCGCPVAAPSRAAWAMAASPRCALPLCPFS